jgi:hypothetical protein
VTQDANTWEVKLGEVAVAAAAVAIVAGNIATTGRVYANTPTLVDVTAVVTVGLGAINGTAATCAAGYSCTGGGFVNGGGSSCLMTQSRPNGNGWYAEMYNASATTLFNITAYARCMKALGS